MLEILNAARKAELRVFYALHHRYRPGDYETWKYVAPIQKAGWKHKSFEDGTWGGEIRSEFKPQPGDILAQEHWCSSGFANTDLDLQLKKHGMVFHDAGGGLGGGFHAGTEGRAPAPDPQGRSYASYASFSDPDGNGWMLQGITTRLPGRVDSAATPFGSACGGRLRRARETNRAARCELARLLRPVHCRRAGRQKAAAMSD